MDDAVSLVEQRHELLRAAADEARAKPELVEATTVARSTVDRAVDELVDAGLLEREGGTYRTTTVGAWMVAEYEQFREAASGYYEHREVVASLPVGERLPPELFAGADVELASPAAPTSAVANEFAAMAELDALYAACPFVLDVYDRYVYELVVDHDVEVEVIFAPSVLETVHDEYAERWRELTETGQVTAYVSDTLPSYVFYYRDRSGSDSEPTEVGITVRDEAGLHVVTNDADDALEWGWSHWTALRDDATRLTATDR